MKKILFLGPKPPPVTGYANIVNALSKCLIGEGYKVKYVSTVPSFLSAIFPNVLWKIARLIYLLLLFPFTVMLLPFYNVLYLNVNGGYGQIFDILVVFVGRIFNKKIVLHHNSYSYIHQKMSISKILFLVAGEQAHHITNCEDMMKKLISRYSSVKNVHVISNISILTMANPEYFNSGFKRSSTSDSNKDVLTLGFMGYYNAEKGIELFSRAVKQIKDSTGSDIKAVAVGPEHDKELMYKLKHDFGDIIEYRPPVYGKKRDKFFEQIDILFFPSLYSSEAEPLTIHHALNVGVPVISTDVGCLKEIVNQFPGCYALSAENYLLGAEQIVTDLLSIPHNKRKNQKADLVDFYNTYSLDSIDNFKKLINEEILVNYNGIEDAKTK